MRKGLFIGALVMSGAAYAQDTAGTLPPSMESAGPSSSASAETPDGGTNYIAVLGSYIRADKDRGTTHNGYGASLVLGHVLNENLALEVAPSFTLYEHGKNKGTDYYQEGGTVDLRVNFLGRNEPISPFLLGGIGGVYDDMLPRSEKKAAFIVDGGAGFVTQPFYGVALRAEARYLYDFHNGLSNAGFGDIRGSIGFEIPLGIVNKIVVAAPEPVTMVTAKEVPRPWIDTDGDGVDDEHDKCPGTPKGLKVDADGCVIPGQVIVLRGVTFEFNKTRIQPNAAAVLDSILPAFTGQANLHVEIAGHTDSVGKPQYNQKLSQSRADAVRNYLIGLGALPEQLRAVGYGKSQLLINPEKSEADRELNRRVEFRVVEK